MFNSLIYHMDSNLITTPYIPLNNTLPFICSYSKYQKPYKSINTFLKVLFNKMKYPLKRPLQFLKE